MAGHPLVPPGPELTGVQRTRYARHLLLPGFGAQAQRRLRAARVLVVGAGGLGSPALLYLAGAGVGTLGIVDDDRVDVTNLQRQVVHGVADVGAAKVASAAATVRALDPSVAVVEHELRLEDGNALDVIADYDLVLDGADNFPTRYLVGDACARLEMPHVWGSVYRFDAQVSVWWAGEGPCYRCVFPTPPTPGQVPSCATGGVLGAVCGAVGSVMAAQAIALLTGVGEPLVGTLVVHDALRQTWDRLPVRADPACPVCGSGADPGRPLGAPVQEDVCRVQPAAAGRASGRATDLAADPPSVSVTELAAALRAGDGVLVDVREAGEREVAAIAGARHVPLADVRSGSHDPLGPGRVFVHCKTGGRSAEAVRVLRSRGVDAVDVRGGIAEWARVVDPSLPDY